MERLDLKIKRLLEEYAILYNEVRFNHYDMEHFGEYLKAEDKRRQFLVTHGSRLKRQYGFTPDEIAFIFDDFTTSIKKYLKYGKSEVSSWRRREVIKRDGNMCALCTFSDCLCVHHVFGSRNHSMRNLLTLCGSCHPIVHGIKRRFPKAYEEFMKIYVTMDKNLK